MIQPGPAACATAAIITVYILSVLMTIRMVNAKGRKWGGLRVIIYLYPVLGPMVAMLIPARREAEASSQTLTPSASEVKLLLSHPSEPSRSLGRIEVEIARPSEHSEPTTVEVAGRLRSAAADKGANAVAEVEFIRSRPGLWTMKPRHVLRARGVALQLPSDIHATAVSDAEDAAQVIDADAREALKERLMTAGVAVARKSKVTAYLMWLLLGWSGVHRFYCRKWISGLLWLLTLGLFGLGWGADAVLTRFMVDQANGIPPQEDPSKVWVEVRICGAYFAGPFIGLFVVSAALSWISAKLDKRRPAQKQQLAQQNPLPNSKVTPHNDAAYGYALSYPSSWRAQPQDWGAVLKEKASDRKLLFVAVSPDQKLHLQVAVFNDPPREGESLKQFLEGNVKEAPIPSENAKTTDIEIDGRKAIRYLADATTPVGQPARYLFVLVVWDGRVWIFGIGGNRNRFQDEQNAIDDIVHSIKFHARE